MGRVVGVDSNAIVIRMLGVQNNTIDRDGQADGGVQLGHCDHVT